MNTVLLCSKPISRSYCLLHHLTCDLCIKFTVLANFVTFRQLSRAFSACMTEFSRFRITWPLYYYAPSSFAVLIAHLAGDLCIKFTIWPNFVTFQLSRAFSVCMTDFSRSRSHEYYVTWFQAYLLLSLLIESFSVASVLLFLAFVPRSTILSKNAFYLCALALKRVPGYNIALKNLYFNISGRA